MSAFDYTIRDFDTIRADLLARSSVVFPEWVDRDPSDFGMLLVDLWAHQADVLHYYIDRAAGEAFLDTATQRESVLATANLLDYTPRGRESATAFLTVQNSGASVNIAAYTPLIASYNGTPYQVFTATSASVPANGSLSIPITEGTRYVEEVLTSSASGAAGQRYTLSRLNVSPSSLAVYVYEDGVTQTQYRSVSRITAALTGQRVYSTYVAADGSLQIILGTSLNGFIPPSGSKITVTYVVSSGASGNLPANSVLAFVGSTPANISITGATSFTGGVDDESLVSLKRSIPSAISAQNRAVTRADFIALALQVPSVSKASLSFVPGLSAASAGGASVGTNASVTIYPQVARSDYLTTTDTFQSVSSAMQTNVVNTLQPLALLGVTVLSATTVQFQGIDIQVIINVQDKYVQQWVKDAVTAALNNLFSFDNVIFGQRLTLGQVYRIIYGVAGVDYANVTRFDLAGSTGTQTSILIDPLKIPKKGTFTFTMVGGTTTT